MNHRLHALATLGGGALTGAWTPFLKPVWRDEEREAVAAWRRGELQHERIEPLRQALTAQFGPGCLVVPTNSGRAAIQLALQALELPPGSEVLLPSYSCTGVIVPVVQAGLAPVLVDVDADLNISLETVEAAASPSVKALILPHLAGVAARDAASIVAWARARGIRVIEDAAQSFGLRIDGRLAGAAGDVGVFSSGGGKPLFGPGGGWLVTRDPRVAQWLQAAPPAEEECEAVDRRVRRFLESFLVSDRARARRLLGTVARGYARRAATAFGGGDPAEIEPYTFSVNAISGVEAGIAAAQVRRIPGNIEGRARNAALWRTKLQTADLGPLRLPSQHGNVHTKFWIQFEGPASMRNAQRLKAALWRCGVEIESLYVPLHLRPPFAGWRRAPLPETERRWRALFCVPVRPDLAAADWARIDAALHEVRR